MDLNEKSSKFFEKVNKERLNEHLESILPENSLILDSKNRFVKQFIEYSSIENDIEFVKISIEKLIEYRELDYKLFDDVMEYRDPNFLIKKSLYVSLIICHNRCFNSGKGRLSLNTDFIKKCVPKSENKEKIIDFHKKVINLRNKFVAHADNYHLEETVAFLQFQIDDKDGLTSRMNYAYSGSYSFREEELILFEQLTDFLLDSINKKKSILSKKIMEQFSKEEYVKMGINTIIKPAGNIV